ncbi:MAG: DNA repair protein RadA [Nitrospirae bacterium]|nr:MAG: DNA repair protein RadA [Nitrospirota bacterium]
MAKLKRFYRCQNCGAVSVKWLGRCPDCGQWNSYVEEAEPSPERLKSVREPSEPKPLNSIVYTQQSRKSTGIGELDRVLGGGVVPGCMVLIGGDPGVGKSTLLLQALKGYVNSSEKKGLYVSGEESAEQIKLRAERLGISSENILVMAETVLENILQVARECLPDILVIDSIQTIYTEELTSAPGTVGQVRECSYRLMNLAKQFNLPTFVIGHVTKEGALAGPRVLEHIVDTVLYFEGERSSAFRVLRAVKNRFGSTNEIGVFEMTDRGLREIENPSEIFMQGFKDSEPGAVYTATVEGTRPIIVEIQALVSPTVFGMPRRTSIGVDYQRVNLLVAVLEKIGGVQLGMSDIYLNVVGGLRVFETAVDLPVLVSITSSFREIPVDRRTIVFGEVGLAGEVRPVGQTEARLKEAQKIGFNRAIVPEETLSRVGNIKGIELLGVNSISSALEICFGR